MKKLNLILWSICFIAFQTLSAQTFTGIDVMPGAAGSIPVYLTSFNGMLYFSAVGDTLIGRELYVSNGTAGGTHIVKDIAPGPYGSAPTFLTVCNGALYFYANDSIHGAELWKSDGTAAGTNMVADIVPGLVGSSPYGMTAFNGKVYFIADDNIHGNELWVTDGTSAGTNMVKDINPGISSSNPIGVAAGSGTIIYQFNEYNNKLYFRADDGVHGVELWSTDGSTLGTNMVADILPGPGAGNPYFMTTINGKIVFGATDSINGYELWVSDGTTAGTSMLKNINPGVGGQGADPADFTGFVPFNGKLYFNATQSATGYELWSTDGTTLGTTLVKDILPGPGNSSPGEGDNFFVYNNKLYFPANDSINGKQLWSTDGTASGTTLVKVLSGYTPYYSNPTNFILYNNQMIFKAGTDSINQIQLWTSDGTATGTHIIAPAVSPNPDPLGFYNVPMVISGGMLFANAYYNAIGDELWVYSTPSGITETSGDHMISAYPNPFSTSVTISGLLASERYTVQILDLSGREYYSTELSNVSDASVSMPELTTGVYLMRVAGQSSSQTFKLVKN